MTSRRKSASILLRLVAHLLQICETARGHLSGRGFVASHGSEKCAVQGSPPPWLQTPTSYMKPGKGNFVFCLFNSTCIYGSLKDENVATAEAG